MVYSVSSRGREDTRDAILDAAREQFETNGYHGVALETVARQAGVSRQAIYLHFDSKATLLTALHQRVFEVDVDPELRKVWACPDADAGLDAFVSATAAVAPRILGLFVALDSAARVEEVASETLEPPREGRRADCARMARWLADEGRLASGVSATQASDVLFALASIQCYENLVVVCGWSTRRWTTWLRSTLRTLLLA
jgi:AcrR family transcriptional regulator